MRLTFLFSTYVLLVAVIQVTAQRPNTISDILQTMKSASWAERSQAFDRASELLASGKLNPDDSDHLKLGIIQLLVKENLLANVSDDEAVKESAKRTSDKHKEEIGDEEYYPSLISFVVDMNDERAIPALVGAMPYASDARRSLLGFGDKAIGPILDQLKSRNALLRASALSMAIDMEGRNASVGPSHIREMLTTALTDPDSSVRGNAVNEIACLHDRQNFVSRLKKLAETDPVHYKGRANDGFDGDQFYPVRFDARRALREIQNNEPCSWRH